MFNYKRVHILHYSEIIVTLDYIMFNYKRSIIAIYFFSIKTLDYIMFNYKPNNVLLGYNISANFRLHYV